MNSGGGDNGAAAQARSDEQARQAQIRSGTDQVNNLFNSQFNDDYFGKQRQNYLDYAQPQLDQQYSDAQKQLTFALARGGLLDSSTRASKEGELQRLYDTNAQQVGDQALSNANTARNNVESARSDLISSLNATGDAQGAVNSANSRAAALSQPAAYSPLGQLFSNFLTGIGSQAALEKANYASGGAISPTYQTGLFAPSTNSVKVS